MQVEVSVAQLAVNGAERLQVLGPHLDCSLEEGHTSAAVPRLAQPLPFQGQFQARGLHPAAGHTADIYTPRCNRTAEFALAGAELNRGSGRPRSEQLPPGLKCARTGEEAVTPHFQQEALCLSDDSEPPVFTQKS